MRQKRGPGAMTRIAVQSNRVLALVLLVVSLRAQPRQFPDWRGKTLQLPALWEATPIIAVGDVTNITEFGVQAVQHLPPPMIQDVHNLYWCQGDFHAEAVIKGDLSAASKRYLWASVNPGCRLFYGDRASYEKRITRVWFLREDGQFLRPTFDGGSRFFLGLFTKWSDVLDLPPRAKLGVLLLTPRATTESLREFAAFLWNVADIACSLLGRSECVQRIRAVAALGDPDVRTAACQYLETQQSATCVH